MVSKSEARVGVVALRLEKGFTRAFVNVQVEDL